MINIREYVPISIWMAYKRVGLLKYYLNLNLKGPKTKYCVLKIDGRVHHGGLCDRVKSAVTIYAICKANSIPFKMYFSSPFQLKDVLIPNKYDWIISEEELTKSIFNTKVITSYRGIIRYKFKKKTQVHVYNFGGGYIDDVNYKYGTDYQFSILFSELFKPGELLSKQINEVKKRIGRKYISVSFRFQSLMGDFYEGKHFKKISQSFKNTKKNELIELSIKTLFQIQQKHPNMPLLVTSDSATFLSIIKKINNIVTVPGRVVHMDFTFNEDTSTYLKSYLDLFMLSGGEKIYHVSGKGLYESGFPKVAALMNNKEIEFVKL